MDDNAFIDINDLLIKYDKIKDKIKEDKQIGIKFPQNICKQFKLLTCLLKKYLIKYPNKLYETIEIINLINELYNFFFNKKTIVILLPLEQPNEIFNIPINDLVSFANLKEWNVILEDTSYDPIKFINLAKKYIDQGYKYFIGGATSNEVISWNNEIQNKDVTLISPSSSAIIENKSNTIIRLIPSDQVSATAIFSFLNGKNISPNNIGILASNNTFGNSLANQLQIIYTNRDSPLTYIDFYNPLDPNEIILKAQKLYATFNNENQYTIIIGDQEVKIILDQRPIGNNSFSILPDHIYNYFLLNSINPIFQTKILASGYLGASTITSLDRTNIQSELFLRFGVYGSTYDLNVMDTLQFFDYAVEGNFNSDHIADLMGNYYGATGNLHLNILKDRNNDAFSIARVRSLDNILVWEDISYQALKDTIVKNGVILDQTLSSFPELTNVNVHIIPTIKWDVVKYTNFNGMTYSFNNILGDPFPYPVSFRLELISNQDDITILIPPTASTSAIVVASVIKNNMVESVTLSGTNRIINI